MGNPTQPIRKNLTRPEQVTGRVRAKIFDPKLKKSDPIRKLHTKLWTNPTQLEPDPTRPDHIMSRV